jgi:alginate O-acetyltransferase complex protein AlgI
VSFFPLLVAGPIERATHLLPQIKVKRTFDYANAVDGLRQILWGLFKKVVIADNFATFANEIFQHSSTYSGSTLVMGAIFFAFQIYGDFSGYSDIAIGTARLFGIDLLRNFAYPYFSRDIAEFWRRWHISLSSWFKDYLYIPLGGSRGGMWITIRNTFIIFLVSGFWHGANWTFIIWGALHALYIMPSILRRTNRNHLDIVAKGKLFPSWKELGSMIVTFGLATFAWIFFRSETVGQAFRYIRDIFKPSLFTLPDYVGLDDSKFFVWLTIVFLIIEWRGRDQQYGIANLFQRKPHFVRIAFYYILLFLIFFFNGSSQEFIYFQF